MVAKRFPRHSYFGIRAICGIATRRANVARYSAYLIGPIFEDVTSGPVLGCEMAGATLPINLAATLLSALFLCGRRQRSPINCWHRVKGIRSHRFGGSHSDKKVEFEHTNASAGAQVNLLPHFRLGKFRADIKANNYPPADRIGEAMLKQGARSGNRGSNPWPGCGDTKRRKATNVFAAFCRQEHTQNVAHR
jgi:hypothetical protein